MNIRSNQNSIVKSQNDISKMRELKRKQLLNEHRKNKHKFPSFIKNVIELYVRISDFSLYVNPNIQQITNPLPEKYVSLIENTFISIFCNNSNEMISRDEISNNYDIIKAVVFGMDDQLNFFYNMLMNDFVTYELINDIYNPDEVFDFNENEIDELILLSNDDFVELIDILRYYISSYKIVSIYNFDDIYSSMVSNEIISIELLHKYDKLLRNIEDEIMKKYKV